MEQLKEKLGKVLLPSSQLIDYLFNRVIDDNYRGWHISQHNRYNLENVVNILKELNKYEILEILVGDDKGFYENSIANYRQFVNNIRLTNRTGTLNSIKKNLFPDFDRMGLIERYDENKNRIVSEKRSTVKYVKISDIGKKLINSNSLKEKYFHYLRAIEKLSNGRIEIVKNILIDIYDENAQLKKITVDEFTLFITGIDQTFNGHHYSYDDILIFLKEFRTSSKFAREAIVSVIKNWCDDIHNLDNINKLQDRDWHNWKNESQQIITLFSQTSYFEKDNQYSILLRFGNDSLFSDIREAKRSLIQKHLYFEKNSINKNSKYELHHIVSLYEADTIDLWKLLDVWENMIYIAGTPHNEIHGKNYFKCYKLIFSGNDIKLQSIFRNDKYVVCKFADDVLYNPINKKLMENKNYDLLYSIK